MGVVFTCSTDDGYPSDMKMAELLSKHGLNGTFYIPIKNRDGFDVLTHVQNRDLARQFEIGSHTYDHCYLKNVDRAEAYYQISEGKKRLEDILGRSVPGFCYPGGKYSQRDAELVKASGFTYARTTTNLCFSTSGNRFEIPTTVQFYPHRPMVYLRNFAKDGDWFKRRDALRLVVKHAHWLDRLHALFDHACQSSSWFHLWGHSKEIDELNAWHQLDHFLAHVAANVSVENRLNNQQLAARYF